MPLWIVGHRTEDNQGFVGATELSPDGEPRPMVVDLVDRRTRCFGLMAPAAAPSPDVLLDSIAHLTCTNGTSILIRFAFSGPESGQGIGRDASGNRYHFTAYLRDEGDGQKLTTRLKALRADPPAEPIEPLLRHVSERQVSATRRTLLNSKLHAIRRQEHPVPRYMYGSLPKDIVNIENPQRRKALFMRILLPLIAQSNEVILKDRVHLLALLARIDGGEQIGELDQVWLSRLASRYRTKPGEHSTLRYRVNAVPASLAIAQAALETGWGRSRFVHTGNALYGEWTFGNARGIV
ncbi:MAG: glucosaminidase domain-containing protein, partial [Proteobacteria bacterium]|nr:glucosaminidase domain-containing protein [Pseudomonadota bacterium]